MILKKFIIISVEEEIAPLAQINENDIFIKMSDFRKIFNKNGRPMVAPTVKILNFDKKIVIFAKNRTKRTVGDAGPYGEI